jgi:putative lipoprotein (rSAM/lipoprotein system)
MKIKYLKLKNWLLVSVMSLFGLSACHCNKQVSTSDDGNKHMEGRDSRENLVKPMYGVPTTDYRLQNGQPFEPKVVEQEPPREPQVTVYGVPTVDFAVKGRVVDDKGKPVKGLQVMLVNSEIDTDNLPDSPYWKEQLKRISDTTDAEGAFAVRTTDRPWEKVRVMVSDIDGDENGNIDKKIVDVDFGEPEPTGGPVSSWKLGEKKAEVTVRVERKK